MLYLNLQGKISNCMNSLTILVEDNRLNVHNLLEDSKLRFAMFDMKRRNFSGSNPAMRSVVDNFWGAAMVQDWSILPPHLKKLKIETLNREPIYEDIHRRRNARKIQPIIGFTLIEEVKKAQVEYLRNHGMLNATLEDGPKENQTMAEYCRLDLISERERAQKTGGSQRVSR